ncbi:YtxH domain-containing protein [candidate division WWE3 bacterium]|nr:YtxH domain-containing protein [candidate division WWE3 bacterium]
MECKHCGKNHTDAGSFVHGAMWGALAGAILGMLYAPEKGEDNRAKLKEAFDGAEAKGKELGGKVRDELKDLTGDIKKTTKEIAEAAKPFISELEKSIKPVLDKARSSSQDVQLQVMEKIEQLVEDASSGYDDDRNMKKFFKGTKRK